MEGGFGRDGGLRGPSLRDVELATRIRIAEGTGKWSIRPRDRTGALQIHC